MTRLAPDRVKGMMMGVWFLATSVGNLIAGRVAGFYTSFSLTQLFGAVTVFALRSEPDHVPAGPAHQADAGAGVDLLTLEHAKR
jgi:hypothetical protein